MKKGFFLCYGAGVIASFGGFLQSYAICVIAGALLFINREFGLTPAQDGLVASVILLGALLGSIATGFLADYFGRRLTLLFAAVLYSVANIPIFFISSFFTLLVIRFVTGIAAGVTSLVVPLYLAEIAPSHKRGGFIAGYQLAVTLGTLVAYLVNWGFAEIGHWRWMFFFATLMGTVQGVALIFIPETPKWLFGSGRIEKGTAVLRSLYPRTAMPIIEKKELIRTNWRTLFSPTFRKGIVVGTSLVVLQQWCGINAVVFYAPKIFLQAGCQNDKSAIGISLGLGIVNCIATAFSLFLIDRVGRRTLLLFSQAGVGISLIFFTISLFFGGSTLAIIFLILYLFTYAIGLGPIPWVLIAEIYPLAIRARAIAMMTFLSWLSNFLVVYSFPRFLASFGAFSTFASYAIIAVVSIWCFKRIIPETKGKSLEEIELMLYR